MRAIHSLVIVVFTPLLANCSTHPLVDDVTRSTTFDVVEKIRCEAKQAVIDHVPGRLDNTAIAYEFTFDILETNNASGDVTWTLPVTGGSFALRALAGSDVGRRAQRNFTIVDTFGDLRKANCSSEALEKNWIYPITGEIGIHEVVKTFARLYRIDDPENPGEVFSFHDTLLFTTILGAGVQPTLDLRQATDARSRVSLAQANLGAQRSDIHSVVIAMSAGPQIATAGGPRGQAGSRSPPAPPGSRVRGVRNFHPMRTGAQPTTAASTNNSALSTTLLQTGPDLKQNAIRELDRARILALQDRVRNQVVGP